MYDKGWITQIYKTYRGRFDPTVSKAHLKLIFFFFASFGYLHSSYYPYCSLYARNEAQIPSFCTNMRMPWALSSSLLLVVFTNIPSLSRKELGLASLLCRIPIRPFQPTAKASLKPKQGSQTHLRTDGIYTKDGSMTEWSVEIIYLITTTVF